MITFDQLLENAKKKGYRPLLPPFGDEHLGRPGPHASHNAQQFELAAIAVWVKINLKKKLNTEFDETVIYEGFNKAVQILNEKIEQLPYCKPADED